MVEKKRSEVKRWEMGQKSLIYAFVARGTVILAEYTEFSGNFNSIAFQCLQKLPATNNKFTYNCDGHTFNYLVDNGYTYCVVADESVGRQVPIAFLERAKDDFVAKYGGGKAATAAANSLNKEFGSKLKEHMQYCVDHPEEIGKLAKVKAQVSEVKGVMMENIEKVLDRGEKIELLVDKTETLHHQAQDIRNVGTKMRRKMWLQNMKVRLREERRETTTGARGRSAGPRARAESVDARAVAGRGDHRRGRSLGRGRGDRRSQSRVRCESPEGWVLGAPGITTERTTLAQGLKDYWMRKQRIDKEKKESKYFGIVEKECDEEEKKGMFMKLAKEKKNNQSSWIWSDPAAVIGCSVGNSDTTKKNAAEKNINAAGKNTDAAAETSPSSDTEKHDMFNFDKKQDLFD